jgi:hypothetical protein
MKYIFVIISVVYLCSCSGEKAPAKQIWQVECSDGWIRYESVNRFSPEKEFRMCSIK